MEKHIIFGISPFNTKFSKEYIFNMLDWGFLNFNYVDILHPYEEAKYLIMACGNNEVKARKKTRKEYNRIKKTVDEYMMLTDRKLSYGDIIKFSNFYHSSLYNNLYAMVKNEYNLCQDFREICITQTEKAIIKRRKATGSEYFFDKNHIEIAVEYIMREIPFLINSGEILSSNCHIYISYYSQWSVADYIYKNSKNMKPSKKTRLITKDHSRMEITI